jgi:hypothetical protein
MIEQLPEHELVCVSENPHGSTEKVELLLNDSHLEPQAVRPPRPRGDDDME